MFKRSSPLLKADPSLFSLGTFAEHAVSRTQAVGDRDRLRSVPHTGQRVVDDASGVVDDTYGSASTGAGIERPALRPAVHVRARNALSLAQCAEQRGRDCFLSGNDILLADEGAA